MGTRLGRRALLRNGAHLGLGAALAGSFRDLEAAAAPARLGTPASEQRGWRVGVQLYTYRHVGLYEALDSIAALGVRHIEPCFFLGLDKARPKLKSNEDLPDDVRRELKAKLDERGMALSSFYANLGADAGRDKKIFEFCKAMGTGTIVAEPPAEAFDRIEKLAEDFAVNVTIHNHPESPKQKYWNADHVLAVCKGRGKRIGACCDTGHWVRSGLDPVECLKQLEGRILSIHLKDAAEKGKRGSRDVPLGEGQANYAAVLQELKRQGYKGPMVVEYEHQSPALQEEVAKCVAFVEKAAP
jgi:sugar phosphate isomerase/epimerase